MSIITSVMSLLSNAKTSITSILVAITLSAISYGLYEHSESLQTKLDYELAQKASIEANLKSSQESIVTLNNRIKASKIASKKFSEATEVINNKYLDLEKRYNNFLGRDHIIQKKPTLVNKRMNKTFNTFVDEVSCRSGVETSCIKN